MKTLFVLLTLFSVNAFADSFTAKVDFVQVNVEAGISNVMSIKFAGISSSSVTCEGGTPASPGKLGVALDTEAGQAVMSLALAAQLSDRELFVVGKGTCIGSLEKISYVRIL